MDPAVDAGDIIAQSIFNIEQIKSGRALYDVCLKKGLALFMKNVDSIFNLENERIPQDNSLALSYSRKSVDFTHNYIQWDQDSRYLTNWIKALIFPPFQFPVFFWRGGMFEVVAVEPELTKKNIELPGTVIFKDDKRFKVATKDSYVIVEANPVMA